MAEATGNSNEITREYLNSLLIETRYMNSAFADASFELFGKKFSTPIMTAALSHLEEFVGAGASKTYAEGAVQANAVLWYGMAEEPEIEMMAGTGASLIEVIKPYKDRDKIFKKIEHAVSNNLLAVGIDIDHPFSNDGSADLVFEDVMAPLSTEEFRQICDFSKLPVIPKGVLSVYDANEVLEAGAAGMLLSHHNNRITYAVPPVMLLPEIIRVTEGKVPVFVDCEIRTGMDAFKALALGAAGVCVGRPFMPIIKNEGAADMAAHIQKLTDELKKAMAFTGCYRLDKMDASVIHKR